MQLLRKIAVLINSELKVGSAASMLEPLEGGSLHFT